MGQLFDEVVGYLVARNQLEPLLGRLGTAQAAEAKGALVLATAAVIGHLAGDGDGEGGGDGPPAWLAEALAPLEPSPGAVGESAPVGPAGEPADRAGERLLAGLYGPDLSPLAARIGAESGLTPEVAAGLLGPTARAVADALARQAATPGRLGPRLRLERRDLTDAGWGPWLASTARPAPGADRDGSHAGSVSRPAGAAVGGGDRRALGPRALVLAAALVVLAGLVAALVAGGGLDRGSDDDDALDPATEGGSQPDGTAGGDDDAAGGDDAPGGEDGAGAGGGAGGDDDSADAGGGAGDEAGPAAGDDPEAGDGEPGDPAGGAGDPGATAAPETVEYRLQLADLQGGSDAGGQLDLRFDTTTGEVCYRFDVTGLDSPHDAHIHAGPQQANGGIVVDFTTVSEAPEACLESTPADLISIAENPGAHYVEVHDPGGALSLRSQLAELAVTPDEEAHPDAASVVIGSGTVVVGGRVTDRATADALVDPWRQAAGDGFEVVDELVVDADAPPPAGPIVVQDTILFAVDSVALSARDRGRLEQLAAILAVQPAWTTTVVGHTDGTGSPLYNFGLSLRRAETVRDALVEFGLPAGAVTVLGDGPFDPVGDNETAGGQAENRRIEFRVRRSQPAAP